MISRKKWKITTNQGRQKHPKWNIHIRWHIKIHLDKDPALYTMFNEGLQRILNEHREHWDVNCSRASQPESRNGKRKRK